MNLRELIGSMNKQERIAWLGVASLMPVALYLAWQLFVSASGGEGHASVATQRTGGRIFMVYMACYCWIVFRDKSRFSDERDRLIAIRGVAAAYLLLALAMIGVAFTIASPRWQPYWTSRSPAWLEAFFMFCLIASLALGWCTRVAHYWRDRR